MNIKFKSLLIISLFLIGEIISNKNKKIEKKTKLMIEDEDLRPFKFALSTTYLPQLAITERKVYKLIKKFNLSQIQKVMVIKKYIEDFEDSGFILKLKSNEWKAAINFTKNPISSYRMIRRLTQEYVPLEKYLKKKNETGILEELEKLKNETHGFPDKNDLSESLESLLVLQDFHDLKANKIASGKLIKTETGVQLNSKHCFEISEFAKDKEFYNLALDWLNAAEQGKDNVLNVKDLKELKHDIITKHDLNWDKNIARNHSYIFTKRFNAKSTSDTNETIKKYLSLKYVGNLTTELNQQTDFNFMAICKGLKFMSAEQEKNLFCWIDAKRHPFWIINPLKIELVSNRPYAIVIYDVLPDSWINQLIQTASKIMRRVPNDDATRTTTYGWLHPEGFSNIPIEKRSAMLFNLETGQDLLQVNSYTSGAWVNPHVDFYNHGELVDFRADRLIASTIFYLTGVKEGGETAFPYLGISVKPIKGSVLMWHPILRNGEVDKRMVHGSCPVVLGHKWIAAKWIHSHVNFLKRPCHLDKSK